MCIRFQLDRKVLSTIGSLFGSFGYNVGLRTYIYEMYTSIDFEEATSWFLVYIRSAVQYFQWSIAMRQNAMLTHVWSFGVNYTLVATLQAICRIIRLDSEDVHFKTYNSSISPKDSQVWSFGVNWTESRRSLENLNKA